MPSTSIVLSSFVVSGYGGIGVTTDGTNFAKPLQVTDDEEQAYRLSLIACTETAAMGGNWSFTPVIDIDINFQNPLRNTQVRCSGQHHVRRGYVLV